MKRIQRKKTKGWKMPANTIYVGRPSKWGNPYVTGKDGAIREVLQKYEQYVRAISRPDGACPTFLDDLRGKDLACWCPLDKPCHADVILRILEAVGVRVKDATTEQTKK